MWKLNLLFIAICICSEVLAQNQYCNMASCKNRGPHIACLNPTTAWNSTCPPSKNLYILKTDAEVKEILQSHNILRSKVASGSQPDLKRAAKMVEMSWDPELALMATINVKQCAIMPDNVNCKNTKNFPFVGQSIFEHSVISQFTLTPSATIKKAMEFWTSQISSVTQDDISKCCSYTNPNSRFSTQMITDDSFKIGCAMSSYTKKVNNYPYNFNLLCCNYARANKIGSPVYAPAVNAAAEKCTKKTSNYPGLCNVDELTTLNA